MIGIYKIENLINHKVYIGQSKDIERRWKDHRTRIYREENDSLPLYRAFRKYGIENFSFNVIELCKIEELDIKEKEYIKKYDSFVPNGYNLTLGGQHSTPQKITPAQAKEIIRLLKTTFLSQTQIAKLFKVSQNTISDINTGCCWLDEKETYPIRKNIFVNGQPNKTYFCVDCGKKVSKGAIRCESCNQIHLRKVSRPSRQELKQEIRNYSFVELGKKYNVSDNAIRKWCKFYNLPSKRKEIKSYTNEEWEKI